MLDVGENSDESASSFISKLWGNALLRSFIIVIICTIVGMLFATNFADFRCDSDQDPDCKPLTYAEAFYWVIITSTTVGFGDFSPLTEEARCFGIFYLFAAVIAMASFLSNIAGTLFSGVDLEDVLATKLSEDMIMEIDKSGDGVVSEVEWLSAVLTVMGRVEPEIIDAVLAHFRSLDHDGSGKQTKEVGLAFFL